MAPDNFTDSLDNAYAMWYGLDRGGMFNDDNNCYTSARTVV